MSKAALFLRTSKQNICLGGAIFEWKKPAPEYLNEITRTTIALIRPHKVEEGTAIKLLGYDKLSTPKDKRRA